MGLFSDRKHSPLPWRVGEWTNGQTAILAADGRLIATLESGNQTTRDADAALIVATLPLLQRLTEKVERANSIQHSGGKIVPEDWAELWDLANESRTLIGRD
jgi:hypothetical protein